MKPTNKWRTIKELSCMINNEERVYYSDHEIKEPPNVDTLRFDNPHIVFSRPVFDVEIEDGLKFCKDGTIIYDDKNPESRPPMPSKPKCPICGRAKPSSQVWCDDCWKCWKRTKHYLDANALPSFAAEWAARRARRFARKEKP